MKATIAYVLIVLGVPAFVGLIASAVIQLPVAWLTPNSKRTPDKSKTFMWQTLEAVSGFVAILVSLYIFKFLSVRTSVAIPLIVGTWIGIYYQRFSQPKWEWFCWLIGIALGWFLLPQYIIDK